MSDSPGSRWPAGWLSTSRPSIRSCTNRSLPPSSITAATVALGFQTLNALASGCLAGVLADEIRHSLDACLDRLLRGGVRKAHVLSLAGHARAEVDIGKHRDSGFQEQALPELLGILGPDHAASLGDVGPGVEGAARHAALHARDLVQQGNDQVPSLEEAVL